MDEEKKYRTEEFIEIGNKNVALLRADVKLGEIQEDLKYLMESSQIEEDRLVYGEAVRRIDATRKEVAENYFKNQEKMFDISIGIKENISEVEE